MFKSKNFFVALGISIFVSALIWWVYINQKNNLPDIFDYIPINMDQVMINRAEKNIQNNANILVDIPQAVQEQFQQIKVMIIVQDESFPNEQIVFLETKSDFLPEDFLETINPEDETINTYLRLNDWQYVFGPQKFIQSYAKPELWKSLFKKDQLQKYLYDIRESSLSIISHNNDLFTNSKYSSLLDSAEYLLINISSENNWNFDFSAYVLFGKSQKDLNISFKPKFTSFLRESTIAYLEIGKIWSWIDLSNQMTSNPIQDNIFKKLLSDNFAIILSNWSNMFNLWVTIISNDKTLFSDLETLFPLLGVWLQNQPMISGSQVTSFQQPGKIGYDIVLQDIQKIWIYLEQSDNQTKLTLWNPTIDGKSQKLKWYSKNSLAVIDVDMNQLLALYKQFSNIGINTSVLSTDQESAFNQMKDKTLRWEISIEEDSINIKWSIK